MNKERAKNEQKQKIIYIEVSETRKTFLLSRLRSPSALTLFYQHIIFYFLIVYIYRTNERSVLMLLCVRCFFFFSEYYSVGTHVSNTSSGRAGAGVDGDDERALMAQNATTNYTFRLAYAYTKSNLKLMQCFPIPHSY